MFKILISPLAFAGFLLIGVCNISKSAEHNFIRALKDTLNAAAVRVENDLLQLSFNSIIDIIESQSTLSATDSTHLEELYEIFIDDTDINNPRLESSYLNRYRSMILAWTSPTDGELTYSWLRLPANWNPAKAYPVYVKLHGYWDVAESPINHMSYPYRVQLDNLESFDDGYQLSPWGRGNIWFRGVAEDDIHNCITQLENLVPINHDRKYIYGFSMGGYGAWHIAFRSKSEWAAMAMHGSALWYNSSCDLNSTATDSLKNMPVMFVCGHRDGNLPFNREAYNMLTDAGNTNLNFLEYEGGHTGGPDYLIDSMYNWMRQFSKSSSITNVAAQSSFKEQLNLQVFPQPASELVTLHFNLNSRQQVKLELYTTDGKLLSVIMNEFLFAGKNQIEFYRPTNSNTKLYFGRLQLGNSITTLKLLFVN